MIRATTPHMLYEWARTRADLGVRAMPHRVATAQEALEFLRREVARLRKEGRDEKGQLAALVDYFATAVRGNTDKRLYGWGSLKWAVWGLRDALDPVEEHLMRRVFDIAYATPPEQWGRGAFVQALEAEEPGLVRLLHWAQELARSYQPMEGIFPVEREGLSSIVQERVAIVTVARNYMNEMLRRRGYDWYIGAPDMRVTIIARSGKRPIPERAAAELTRLGGQVVRQDYAIFPTFAPRLEDVLEALGITLVRQR